MKKLKLQVLLVPIHLASLATDSLDNIQTKRFLHLADPSDDLNKIEKDVQTRYKKLYPDEQELDIQKFQDNDLCDLDLDYQVDDVFQSGDLIRVIIFNEFTRYIENTSFSMAKRIEYPNSTNLDMSQSTPMPPAAPTLINNPNISRLERTNEYFDRYTGRIPSKLDIPIATPNINMGKIRLQSPKLPSVDPNMSLPPPEDNYDRAIPEKHHPDQTASPDTQKRITSGMLNLPPHAKLDKEEIEISQNSHEKSVSYSESSSEDESRESSPTEEPKSVVARDLLDKNQLVSKLNDSFVSASSSKNLPDLSNMSSDDDEEVRREAARYQDPLKQHFVISKDEVIDIFKHRIVRANKQMGNGVGKDKLVTQVIGKLSIDMVDAPKASEYVGTRSSRKAPEESRNVLARDLYNRREHRVESLNSPKPTSKSKVEKSSSKQSHDGIAFGEKSQSSVQKTTPKPREPLKKLNLVFDRMKVFEKKLNSLMKPNQIFPKKNTKSQIYSDDDDGDDLDQLIINPKVHLVPNVERNSSLENNQGNQYPYKSSISRSNNASDTSTTGTDNPKSAPLVNKRDAVPKASQRSNGKPKPTPAFNITNDVNRNAKPKAANLPQGNGSNHPVMTPSNGASSIYSTPALTLSTKKLPYIPSHKTRAMELLELAQKKNAATKSQSIGRKSNESGQISTPNASQLIKKAPMGSLKPTPSKRKFDASSSDDDGDSSDSGAEGNESKKPRLVARVPTQRSHSPATPLPSSRSNSTIIPSTNLIKTNPSSLGSQDVRFQTPQSGMTSSFTNSIRKPLLTSLDDLALRGVPDVKETTKSNESKKSAPKPVTTKYDESSSSDDESSSDSSDDDDDDKASDYKSPKFLSLKVASAKKPRKKKSLFSTLKR